MGLERLTYFIDAVDLASFTAAAQKNFVSQTAISKQMKNLEEEIGAPLFHRENNRVTVTSAGRQFYNHAKQLITNYEQAVQLAHAVGATDKQTLTIGFTTYYETQLMSPMLHDFMALHPEIDITISQDNFRDNNQALLSQTIDILFSRNYGLDSLADYAQIQTTVLEEGNMLVAVAEDDPITRYEVVPNEALANRNVIFVSSDPNMLAPHGLTSNAQADGYSFNSVTRIQSLELLLMLIRLKKRIAFFPENSLFSTNGVVFRPIASTSHRYEIVLATNQQNPNTAVKVFTDFVTSTI
ncbi:MAG: LysR family transcriptional regulator [Weissella cibaria]